MNRRRTMTAGQRAVQIERLDRALTQISRYRAVLLKRGGALDLAKSAGGTDRATRKLDLANRAFSQILEIRGTRVTALRKMSRVDGETLAKVSASDRLALSMVRAYQRDKAEAELRGVLR